MRASPALLAALLALACGRSSEKEPNDHFTQATPVKAGRAVRGELSSAADVDLYRIEARRPASLSFRLPGLKGADWAVSFMDSDRRELKRFDETAAGGDEEGLDLGLELPGPYYLAVSNREPRAPGGPYVLELRSDSPQGREREPNDSSASANPVVPGALLAGHYFPSQDSLDLSTGSAEADWFVLKLEDAGERLLRVDVSEVPGVDPVLEVFDANAYRIKELSPAQAGRPVVLPGLGLRGPGEWRLRLRSRARASNAEVPYHLLAEVLPYDGTREFEPNDQQADATRLARESLAGHVFPAGDQDWYRLEASTGSRQVLRVELSAVPGLDLALTVADEFGRPLLAVDDRGADSPEVLTGLGLRSGVTHLIVSEKSGRGADAVRSYRLSWALSPHQAGLEYESNDSSAAAQALRVGDTVEGHLAPRGDADWYEFNVYKRGRLTAETTGLAGVQWRLSLFDQEYRLLDSAEGRRAGEAVAASREIEAGTYAVRLEAGPEQSNVRDRYSLRLRVQ